MGFDGSAEATAALAHAAGRLCSGGYVLAVYAEPPAQSVSTVVNGGLALPGGPIEPPAPSPEPPASGREHEVFAALPAGGLERVRLDCIVVADSPARAPIAVAQERAAEEIVIRARRHGRIHAAISNLSRDLLQHADRPVVIVPPGMTAESSADGPPLALHGS